MNFFLFLYKNFLLFLFVILNEYVGWLLYVYIIMLKIVDCFLSWLFFVNMVDDGSFLFCDDDEICEKNVSEFEDDCEIYVLVLIG